jgi:hypothetical protein
MKGGGLKTLAGRYSVVALLAVIAGATVCYITIEDSRVGDDYGRIFHQNPSLIPADLTSLAALHIQTAATIASMCVTIGLALAFSRIPRQSDGPDDLLVAIKALTDAANALAAAAQPTLPQPNLDTGLESNALPVAPRSHREQNGRHARSRDE